MWFQSDQWPLNAMVSPVITAVRPGVSNPLRRQYEDLLQPLFPQGSRAAAISGVARVIRCQSACLVAAVAAVDPRTLPPDAPDDRKFDFSAIDDALTKLADRNMRLTLRVFAYNSCCDDSYPNNTNIGIPDWVRASRHHRYAPPTGPARGDAGGAELERSQLPERFRAAARALGRRYDRDERLSVFEFSGYGDSGETTSRIC